MNLMRPLTEALGIVDGETVRDPSDQIRPAQDKVLGPRLEASSVRLRRLKVRRHRLLKYTAICTCTIFDYLDVSSIF